MNASEETKSGPSVVVQTLRSLSEQARICHDKIDQLEAARSFNRAEVLADVGKLLDACQNLRDAILSEDATARWSTKDELETLVNRLDETAAKRRRYLDLAQVLSAGTVVHRRERTRQERLALRDKAVAELMEISERPAPAELPGPAVEDWLEWACSLEDDANEPELLALKTNFPRLDDFVRQMEIDWWHVESESIQPGLPDPDPISITKKSSSGLRKNGNGNGNRNGLHRQPVTDPEPEAAEVPETPAETDTAPVEQEELPPAPVELHAQEEVPEVDLLPASAPALQEHSEAEEIPIESLSPSKNGKLSFFPWEQVDLFTRYIDKARVERKETRKIRALLAVAHWLEPREQNPVTHSKCGIRALTGQSTGADFDWVSPSDVMRAINLEDDLPLLTGGADLLRWGLLQPSDHGFQGIASVRRLTPEHLKAWFSELYRIAFSDKQIEDISTLTSGIPLLVGEFHKLIIPQPEDPPTWLGLARWIEIKSLFEKQLPVIAQDLKKGPPSVRLTDREISLLNMVVIVSGDSTCDTIIANLSENWDKYQHPEYRPFSSRDEASLGLLLELGLLPMRNVIGAEPSKTLLPVQHDDAIRKLIEVL